MEIGMIGLGRMGEHMAERLMAGGHRVIAYDPAESARVAAASHGAAIALSVAELARKLDRPRAVWLMVPSGRPTQETIDRLAPHLSTDDIVVDGGNSYYRDSMRRAAALAERGVLFLDVGTSGGIWGLEQGYCLMVGGDAGAYRRMEPVFQTLAPSPKTGYGHVGKSGAGHFAKMVHNAIEYGLLEAYAEGFELMRAKREFNIDLARMAEMWRHGSVVRSWLLDLTVRALNEFPDLADVKPYVEDSGEGRWMIQEATELEVPAPAISLSVQERFRSRQSQPFGYRLIAALRHEFGGHPVKTARRRAG